MDSRQQNFEWACRVLNLSMPKFSNCSFDHAVLRLERFKELSKAKFRNLIMTKHEDKGGDKEKSQEIIVANEIIRKTWIQKVQPEPIVYVQYSYSYSGVGSETATGSW